MIFNNSDLSLIKYPLFTEKSILLSKNKYQYIFLVDKKLKKKIIRNIFETLFKIKIIKLNSCILPKKIKKKNKTIGILTNYKKIYIRFKSNEILSYFKD
jgi:ribosomal protein L23